MYHMKDPRSSTILFRGSHMPQASIYIIEQPRNVNRTARFVLLIVWPDHPAAMKSIFFIKIKNKY